MSWLDDIFGGASSGSGSSDFLKPELNWKNGVGLFGSALMDGYNAYRGRKSDQTGDMISGLQQKALMEGMNSPDPAIRAKAYDAAAAMGIDTSRFEQRAASKAVPDLLKNMQPGTITAPGAKFAMPGIESPGGIGRAIPGQQVDTGPITARRPAMNLTDALAATNNPELSAHLSPDILKSYMTPQDSYEDLTPEQVRQMGLPEGSILQRGNRDNKLNVIHQGKPAAAAPTRTVPKGPYTVMEEQQPDGSWKEIGRRATFAPRAPQGGAFGGGVPGLGPGWKIPLK